jgi:sterol desaturase/sphingolipid hydroxylase (fatty acid hydroxylase superfamily)
MTLQELSAGMRPFLKGSVDTTLEVGLRYFVFAGVAWALAYGLFRRRWLHRKIIARFPLSADVRREIGHSLVTMVIFGLIGSATMTAAAAGWTRMYWNLSDGSQLWYVSSIVIAIFVQDAYFYWTHRMMHHRWLFRRFHRVHHLSRNPTPWAAYSFAPAEAVVEAGIFPLVALTVPIHPSAFGIVMLWQILFNVGGHVGFEYHPKWLMNSPLRLLLNTPTNHVMHHERMQGNYGLYFNLWDRLMGTNHPEYESRFREVTSRPPISDSRTPVGETGPLPAPASSAARFRANPAAIPAGIGGCTNRFWRSSLRKEPRTK